MVNIDQITDPIAVAKSVKLRYVKANTPGFTRQRKGKSFVYLDAGGVVIKDEVVLARIRGLVLPPAWEKVWICTWPNGHLQATGMDAMGRRQYRYHSTWAKARNETKYYRLLQFAANLPHIRKRINEDLKRSTLDKEKVIAIALSVMEETLIRVGNASYEKLYGSHGLTTLQDKHVKINGSEAFFQFKGKKGVQHKIMLRNATLAKLLKNVRDIPGQVLFQYYDANGDHKGLDSGEVNDYIKTCCKENEFTCKDFRTWAGTVNALNLLSDLTPFTTVTECRSNIVAIIDGVAGKLGNTRAVCRKYYIHPQLLESYEKGTLEPWLQQLRTKRNNPSGNGRDGLRADEKVLLQFLQNA